MATYVGSPSATLPAIPHAAASTRRALLASVALAFLTGVSLGGLAAPAKAAMPGYYDPNFYYPDPYRPDPYLNVRPVAPPRPSLPPRPKPNPDPDAKSTLKPDARPNSNAKSALKPNAKPEPAKDFGSMPKGPLQIVVSIANQNVTLYSNGARVAQGPVSTGVPGRPTPTGVFSIIQKDRFHHSNLYSNAPMPYMERITWSGVALHEGPLPGYPASHGCIRMTHDFAARLWVITKLGVRVIVARTDVIPVDFAHPRLFAPKAKPAEPPTAGDDPDKHAALPQPVKVAQATIAGAGAAPPAAAETAVKPAAGAGDPASPPADALRGTLEVASPGVAETTGTVATPADPSAPVAPAAAAAPPGTAQTSPADPPKPTPDAVDPLKAAPLPGAPKTRTADQPIHHAGTVAIFISRREKKLFVRQDFAPLFDVPIEIEHPDQPLGTHVFTALGLIDNGTRMRWNVMTMPAEPRPVMAPKIGPKGHFEARPAEAYAPQTPAQVLERIQIPQEAVDRISEILTPGASLVISDQGLGGETGVGTDFIVLVR
ncbi:MAG TPA: L,D-transpeptidase [Xanthobacteraceae bacterium]